MEFFPVVFLHIWVARLHSYNLLDMYVVGKINQLPLVALLEEKNEAHRHCHLHTKKLITFIMGTL